VEAFSQAQNVSDDMNKQTAMPRLHRQTLIRMNLAAFTARRDAAVGRVLRVLREEVGVDDKEVRVELYRLCLCLLQEAIEATERSQISRDTPPLHCLSLLRDTIAASLALVKYELTVSREAAEFTKLLGKEKVAELELAKDVFRVSEANILQSLSHLLLFVEPILKQDSEVRTGELEDEDRKRYEVALAEYTEFYDRHQPGPGAPSAEDHT
jgi:hypothetical protein